MELEMTGERLVPKLADQYGTFEHLHRYALARSISGNKIVLDIASGEGYGSNFLADAAEYVYGVDISPEAVAHAKSKYQRKNLEFLTGSASKIPLPDNSVDLVVSFETIEHHDQHEEMFREIKRVLRKEGHLFLSSPEKRIYQERDPANSYHIKELTMEELKELCDRYFRKTAVFFQKNIVGSLVYGKEGSEKVEYYFGDFAGIRPGFRERKFFNRDFFNLVLCTDANEVPIMPATSFFCSASAYESEMSYWSGFRSSLDYRVGKTLLSPLRFIKGLFFRSH